MEKIVAKNYNLHWDGWTVVETKQSVADSIALYIKYNKKNLPKISQGDYEIIYKFDTQSLLNYYSC